jgi:hypothetical protein
MAHLCRVLRRCQAPGLFWLWCWILSIGCFLCRQLVVPGSCEMRWVLQALHCGAWFYWCAGTCPSTALLLVSCVIGSFCKGQGPVAVTMFGGMSRGQGHVAVDIEKYVQRVVCVSYCTSQAS